MVVQFLDSLFTHTEDYARYKIDRKPIVIPTRRYDIPNSRMWIKAIPIVINDLGEELNASIYKMRRTSLTMEPFHLFDLPKTNGTIFYYSRDKKLLFVSRSEKTIYGAVKQHIDSIATPSGYRDNPGLYHVFEEVEVGYIGFYKRYTSENGMLTGWTTSQFMNSLLPNRRQPALSRYGGTLSSLPAE